MASVKWDALGGDLLDDVWSAEDVGPDFGDRYELREVLGRGGQGTVHLAWDRQLEREVAIKCLRDPSVNQRPLLEESRLLSRLAHPAIPQVYDRGNSPDGGAYVVMQYVAGERLDRALRHRELVLADRLHLFHGIAGAVRHAHSRGILHRDLKPENVMVTEAGEPYLVDWGLAANGGPRAICGSPYFAAPEQLEGQPADPRADIYALGVLLYFILSGELPYGRSVRSFDEFRRQRAALSRVPLRRRVPTIPPALERMSETAMAAQPAARYQRLEELMADLARVESGRPLARDLPRLPWRAIAAVLAAGLALGGGVLIGRATVVGDPVRERPVAVDPPDAGSPVSRDAFSRVLPAETSPASSQETVQRETTAPEQPEVPPLAQPDTLVVSPSPMRTEEALPGDSAPADATEPPQPAVLPDPLADLEALLPTLGDDQHRSEPDWEDLLPPVREADTSIERGGPADGDE